MLIDIIGWSVFSLGVIVVIFQAVSLKQDNAPKRPFGRHSADRIKPKDLAKEWQNLRLLIAVTMVGPAIVLSQPDKSAGVTRDPVKWLVVLVNVIILIWEMRSWTRITDRADRRRALDSARLGFVPLLVQLTVLLHVWDSGTARIAVVTVLVVVLTGPEVEAWARRRLIRRAGGEAGS